MGGDEREIRTLIDSWMSATKAGDLATVLGLMTDDVVFLVPDKAPFGKAEFAAASAGLNDIEIDASTEIEEIEIAGDWAHLRSRIAMTITRKGGTSVRRAGYTLTLLRRCGDGRWRLYRDANLLTVQS